MAEEGQGLSSFFPLPPPFYKHFTAKNLERLKEIRASANAGEQADLTQQQILELPTELRFLIPPEPPADGKYKSFGDERELNQAPLTLKDHGVPQLYPSPPSTPAQGDGAGASFSVHHIFYLKRIARSILLNFLELTGILSEEPELYEDKINDLENLFINAHQLVNEYRPHQARETLILLMEDQIERKRKEIEGVKTMKVKIDEMLAQLKKDGEELPKAPVDSDQMKSDEEARKEKLKAIWSSFEELDD